MGFFKQWMANASEMRQIQNQLSAILAEHGVNFMHLHPEIHKFLLGLAREEGADKAVATLNETMEMVETQFPGLTQEQSAQQLIQIFKAMNATARGF